MAKFLVPNLTNISLNEFTVKDSFTFAKEIGNMDASGMYMASFDVKSLFTNIPLKETIDIILYETFENPENSGNILTLENGTTFFKCHMPDKKDEIKYFNKEDFKKLLELATLDSYFFFNSEIYKQIDGVAMGSPLGPHLANVFMNHMERKWLQECPDDFKPVLYRRYVDDTFLLFTSSQHIDLFLTYLNSKHPNISFTCDHEQNGILPFLDIKIKRDNKEFETSIYRKPTFTGLFSKYYAFSPKQNKENLVYTLTVRAYKICSTFLNLHKEVEFLKDTLQSNGYPLKFIEASIGKMISKLHKPVDTVPPLNYDVPKAKVYFSTYFLGDLTKTISKEIHQFIGESYPQIQLQFVYKSYSTIGNHFCFKDRQPQMLRSNLIYKYTCERCKAFYIGKTIQQFAARISEHRGISARTGKTLSSRPKSDIFDHCEKCHTYVLPEHFSIVDSLQTESGLLILESLHQKTKHPSIGIHQQSTTLMSFD